MSASLSRGFLRSLSLLAFLLSPNGDHRLRVSLASGGSSVFRRHPREQPSIRASQPDSAARHLMLYSPRRRSCGTPYSRNPISRTVLNRDPVPTAGREPRNLLTQPCSSPVPPVDQLHPLLMPPPSAAPHPESCQTRCIATGQSAAYGPMPQSLPYAC